MDLVLDELIEDAPVRDALVEAFEHLAPRPDEIDLHILPGNCLLTDQRLVLLDAELRGRVFELSEIASANPRRGLLRSREQLHLTTGEVLERKGLREVLEPALFASVLGLRSAR